MTSFVQRELHLLSFSKEDCFMYCSNSIFIKFKSRWWKLLLPHFVIFILCMGSFYKPVADLDELWNYNFARCIYNGLDPYVDFNILQTPMASYVSAFFLGLFGDSLFVFRCLGFGLLFLTFSMLFNIGSLISGNRWLAFALTLLAFSASFLWWIYNYNYFILMMVLGIIGLEYFRCEKAENRTSYVLNAGVGLLIGLIFLAKQSTGFVFLVINLILCLIERYRTKESPKVYVIRVASSFIPFGAYVLFLVFSNQFWVFYDYAFAGIGDFKHSISYLSYLLSSPFSFIIGVFPVATLFFFGISFWRDNLVVSKEFGISVMLLALAGCAAAYPLCDNQHFPIAFVPFMLCFLCCKFKFRRKWIVTVSVLLLLLVSMVVAYIPALTYSAENGYVTCQLNHFENLPIRKGLEDEILLVDGFISEKAAQGITVYIADTNAAGYMIPLDRYNKDFDLLVRGNLGSQSIEDLLLDKYGSIILVRQDESVLNYQSHFELIHYIKDNFVLVDEVAGFGVYEVSGP